MLNKINIKKLALFIIIGVFLINKRVVFAQGYDKYIWERPVIINISPEADDLKVKLESEVTKIVNAGHIAPFRALYGESNPYYYWLERYHLFWTLAQAYPYISPSLQAQVLNYLQQEIKDGHKPWTQVPYCCDPMEGNTYIKSGTRREPNPIDESLAYNYYRMYLPHLQYLYATWLYAEKTGDWQTINNYWSEIQSAYNAYQNEIDVYGGIGGAIGMTRLAHQIGDLAAEQSAGSQAIQGLTDGTNFSQFLLNADGYYQGVYYDDWKRQAMFLGFVFLDMSPEVARFIEEDGNLKQDVLNHLSSGEQLWPLWFMAQAPQWSLYFGEGSGNPPDTRGMLFPIHAWVIKEPPEKLRYYLDVPDALLGDLYYIQNLASTIESYGQRCWEDIRTGQRICEAEAILGDLNKDGQVNKDDALLVLQNWGGSGTGDANGDSKVNGIDLGYVIRDWGR